MALSDKESGGPGWSWTRTWTRITVECALLHFNELRLLGDITESDTTRSTSMMR